MIPEKYKTIIEALRQIADRLDEREKDFILGNSNYDPLATRSFLSLAQKNWLDKLNEKYFGKEEPDDVYYLARGEVQGLFKPDRGWTIYIRGHPVGDGMTKRDAKLICPWLESALAQIRDVINKPDDVLEVINAEYSRKKPCPF